MNIKKIFLCLIVFILFLNVTKPLKAEEGKTENKIILIDPGHGGIDGGAQSKNGTIEKDINLNIAKKLKVLLEEKEYTVFMTRDDDGGLSAKKSEDLSKRCDMKNETKCDVFISIHQNKFQKEKCKGAQVWYSSNKESEKLAVILQKSLKEMVDNTNNRMCKPAKKQYKILRDGYEKACVILECGFLSNEEEEKLLKTEEYQEKIADSIKTGIDEYFKLKPS